MGCDYHIERVFRTLKGREIQIRPIHHRTEARVRAHFSACWRIPSNGTCGKRGRRCYLMIICCPSTGISVIPSRRLNPRPPLSIRKAHA